MVRFNAEIEQAELGIATLLTATGVIRDANGNVRRSAEALNLAQGEARRQLRLLRIEGLRTAATFEQLAETFQVGLAPGLAAGLDVDQVRRFTVQISQAASAVGLQQNQLAEEIRSILSGTIQVRTTRLAVALGITNEDIRQARNAGRLFQFLQTRFQTFSIAGARAARTFNAALVNTQDALAQLLGAGGVELFEQLRQLFLDISETAVTIPDDLSEIRLNPSVVQALRRVGDALGFSVEQARLLVRELSAGDFDATLALTGQSIRDAAVFLRQAFLGAVRGANDLATIVLAVRDAIQRIAGTELFEGVDVETIARLGTIVGGIAVAFLTASGAVGLIASAIGTVASVLAVPVALAGAFTAALVASVTAVQRIVESFTGVRVSIGAALNLITQGIAAAVAAGEASFRGLWASFRLLAFDAYTAVRNGVLNPLLAVIRGALISASFFGSDSAERALQDLNRSQANLNRNLEEERALRAGIKKDLDNTVADIDVILAKLRNAGNDALANPEQTLVEGLRAALNSPLVQDVVQGITGLFSRLADGAAEGLGFKDASSAVTELISRIETLRQQLLEPLQLRFAEGDDAGFVSADRTRSAVGRFIDAWRQGAKEVANELEKTIPSGIEAAVEVLNGVITRFASFVSDLIIDAFDPSNDQTIQQRIGQFLQGIARLVLNTLAQIAIQTAIANIVGALGGNISLPLAIGSGAEGGIVRPGGGPFSFADGTARVPNRPAPFRPRGIPRSDTVNAWLTPGEAVIRRDSARKYGYEVMEALNRGLMDPTAMQAMARRAGGSRSRSRLSRGPGYAAGGVVRSGGRSQSGAQQPAVVGAILEANEQTMERLLAGGRQSMLDFMRRNSAALAPGGR